MSFLNFLIPTWFKYLSLVLTILGLFFSGWYKGAEYERTQTLAKEAQQINIKIIELNERINYQNFLIAQENAIKVEKEKERALITKELDQQRKHIAELIKKIPANKDCDVPSEIVDNINELLK